MTDRVELKPPETDDPLAGEKVIATGVRYEDYLPRFAGRRTEWVMGDVIEKDMTNNTRHNDLLHLFAFLFTSFLLNQGIDGKVLLAGIAMYVGEDKPAREPDLMIVLGEKQNWITPQHLDGAADLCLEIVSPDSMDRDRVKKLKEYEAAGVPEYWLADPLTPELLVYTLNASGRYELMQLDTSGRMASKILPGFAIDPAILWRDRLPAGAELKALVETMGKE